jgi:hypothetical protein
MKITIANFVLLPLFALPAVIPSFTPQELDERRICPVACYGEPLVEGSKGESPPDRRAGFFSSPEKGRQRGRWDWPNVGRGLPLQVDFGPAGLAGLSEVQIWRLGRGEIVLPDSLIKTEEGKTLIEAALGFDQPPEEVWRLLSRTEDQGRYLSEVQKVAVITKTPTDDLLEFTIRVVTKTFVYRQSHRFDEKALCLTWELDPSFPSDIKELTGFWRFYPFAQGKTLGRYGSRVLMKFAVPRSIQEALAKNRLPAALRSVKRYVDSGGTWDKSQGQKTP